MSMMEEKETGGLLLFLALIMCSGQSAQMADADAEPLASQITYIREQAVRNISSSTFTAAI